MKKTWVGILAGLLLAWLGVLVWNRLSSPAAPIGIRDGQFTACPSSPNCVSTMAPDKAHYIEPIEFQGTAQAALSSVRSVLGDMPRVKFVSESENYLHATFTSRWLRFVDDVEFYFDPIENKLHFRSASRIGYSDLGVNRERMERFRANFLQQSRARPQDT